MIVIRSDKDDEGKSKPGKSLLPIFWIIVTFLLLFLVIPLGLVFLLRLPWYLSFIYPLGIVIGIVLVIIGAWFVYKGIKGLRLRYSTSGYDKGDELVTTGVYAYTRNPMYFGATILILGWFLILPFTFILISLFLFTALFFITAKSEEKQLEQKYGKKYRAYKRKVPLFIPYRGKN
jgi:protein-S-isoprenylcysteine O-methyltransferase Ste14